MPQPPQSLYLFFRELRRSSSGAPDPQKDAPFTSNNLSTTLSQPGVSAYQTTGQAGRPTSIVVNRTGRYVRLQLAGTNYLGLAEVEVFGPGAGSGPADVRWLVSDQLGTPRMIIKQAGSLASVSRRDYLPFGEELYAGGRSAQQDFTGDAVRQEFTGYERDGETGLDFAQAHYYSSAQGRFTGLDAGPFTPADSQSWNRYAYVLNNPFKFRDPTGTTLTLTGPDADALLDEFEQKTGYQLTRNEKGVVSIVKGTKRNKKIGSKTLAKLLKQVINDKKVHLQWDVGTHQHTLIDFGHTKKDFDMPTYRVFNNGDPRLGAVALAHVLKEGYEFGKMEEELKTTEKASLGSLPHIRAFHFEGKVLSDYTGHREGARREVALPYGGIRFEYRTIAFDVLTKGVTPPGSKDVAYQADRVLVRERPKKQ